jgi:hypothetical protein
MFPPKGVFVLFGSNETLSKAAGEFLRHPANIVRRLVAAKTAQDLIEIILRHRPIPASFAFALPTGS